MKLLKILVAVAFLTSFQTTAQEMSAEWYRQKDLSWSQTKREYPQSAHPGPFKTRMLEIEAWAKENNTELYYNPNKPYLLAAFVQAEINVEAKKDRDRSYSAEQTKKHEEHNAIMASLEESRPWFWAMFLCLPLLALVGYFRNRDGIGRWGIWGYLAVAVGLIVLMMADRDIFGRYIDNHAAELEGQTRVIGVMIFAYAIGKRARNAGYRWWLAGLSGVPLIALPMVLHLLFFKGKSRTPLKHDAENLQGGTSIESKNSPQQNTDSVETPTAADAVPVENKAPESQKELRARFAMVTTTLWTGEEAYHEPIQEEIKRVMRADSTVNWVISKLGYLPRFPREDKRVMEREVMEILTAFRVDLDPEELPTMAEALEDPQETLLSLMETLISIIDLRAGERD
jgi:hypothetical protein